MNHSSNRCVSVLCAVRHSGEAARLCKAALACAVALPLGAALQQQVPRARFVQEVETAQQRLGGLQDRQWAQATALRQMQPGQPDVPLTNITFASSYAKVPQVLETAQYRLQNGQWYFNAWLVNFAQAAATPGAASTAP